MLLVDVAALMHMHCGFMNSFLREQVPDRRAQSTIHFCFSSLSLSGDLFAFFVISLSLVKRRPIPFSVAVRVCGLINMSCIRAHLSGVRSTLCGYLAARYNHLVKAESQFHRTILLKVLKTIGILPAPRFMIGG